MAGLRSLVFLLVAACCFLSLINAAAVHNSMFEYEVGANVVENENRETKNYIVFPDTLRTRRSINSDNPARTCHSTTPCGWAVYVPFTRRVDYFMRNTCSCPLVMRCIRTDDDLSVSAYVYRCRTNVSETDIESPNTDGN